MNSTTKFFEEYGITTCPEPEIRTNKGMIALSVLLFRFHMEASGYIEAHIGDELKEGAKYYVLIDDIKDE